MNTSIYHSNTCNLEVELQDLEGVKAAIMDEVKQLRNIIVP